MVQILKFLTDEEGATALEYGLLAALIAAAIVASVTNLGQVILNAFNFITAAMQAAVGGGS
ncbi:Flp family type IVb pilin [Candidatus Nitronereus thalassa]|uniref:Flp family type IVb pilin n=1 Tax=Candidatus Nitronereus thalassa TaxID=3020898 RepID=A0ABU3K3N0_9BACT|nr:Flp family type IVb pilin [Candidatus Nitronereus thalassa]MDT7040999.1 Flp family type IVb pilin [Candidatus Nitronereus thalassa]